jgi:hypothetical protein
MVWATDASASHDSGERVELNGVSADGRYALMAFHDEQKQYTDWFLSDVDGAQSTRRRFVPSDSVSMAQQKAFLGELRRDFRLRSPPTPRSKHRTEQLNGVFYTWLDAAHGLHRAFALVGRLAQRVEAAQAVPCFMPESSDCPQTIKPMSASLPASVHWFASGVYLVVDTWQVKAPQGDTYRAIIVHRRLPSKPQHPYLSSPPNVEGK